ncbi:hypothetical protein V2S66_32320 [Streptomyces sp. V4-01]|uniref:Integral membrane protein n=1 Tax=Actinacidiphila polyblastidii TaxID=3110430 RepID=A0ABU7PNL9_9ACTN|nr:hypothetical protein [Streptomyces sp. V4-01]
MLLFAAVAAIGAYLQRDSPVLRSPWPPLEAWWGPHAGPGTPAALVVAAAVVGYGPGFAARLPSRALPWAVWGAAMAWTWSLALVDGWQRGVAGRLTDSGEYLRGVGRFEDDGVGATLRDFTRHILLHSPDHWGTHIAGHPAGAVLTFVGLDRIGLGGGVWGAVFCITTGGSAAAAAVVTLRLLAGAETARRAAPFLALAPGAVWTGVSADGYFAGVAAWSLALLAIAVTRRPSATAPRTSAAAAAFGCGLLLGAAAYLSYGLVLLVIPVLVLLVCARTMRPLPYVVLGAAVVVAAFSAAGFDWWQAYGLLRTRYFEGYGGIRPYAYWFWGDLGTVVAAAGLASVAGLRRTLAGAPVALRGLRHAWRRGSGADPASGRATAAVLLPCALLLAMLAADLSGMSKAETERIWLPFTLWLPATAALLPRRDHRGWLAAQAVTALLVNHLLLTGW